MPLCPPERQQQIMAHLYRIRSVSLLPFPSFRMPRARVRLLLSQSVSLC
jgi:hypothetical protein